MVALRVDHDAIAFPELALQHAHGQGIKDQALQRPLQRPGAIGRIIPFPHQQVLGRVSQLHVDLPLLEPLEQVAHLDADDRLDVGLARGRGRR